MTTDFRALCKELTNELHGYASANPHHDSDELVARARLALAAEPEPPADGEVAELSNLKDRALKALQFVDEKLDLPLHNHCNAIHAIHTALERLAPQPVPERPSDEELTLTYAYAVAAAVDNKRGPFKNEDVEAAQLAGLRTVLARWGHAPNA